MIVGIDDQVAVVGMSGEVMLPHASAVDALEIIDRVVMMIVTADVDIVDVEQQVTVGFLRDRGEEFPLGHRVFAVGNVTGQVFDQHLPADEILHPRDALGDMIDSFLGIGQRQQVVHIFVIDPGPAQVVGKPMRLDSLDQRLEPLQVIEIEFVTAAQRHGYAVHDHRVIPANRIEKIERLAAVDHVVFAQDFEPVDILRLALEDVLVMLRAQAEAKAEIRFLRGFGHG